MANEETNILWYIKTESSWKSKLLHVGSSLPLWLGAYHVPKVNPSIFIIFHSYSFFQIMLTFNCLFFSLSLFFYFEYFENFLCFFSVLSYRAYMTRFRAYLIVISTCFCAMYDQKSNFWLHRVMSFWEENALSLAFFSLIVNEEVRKIVFLAKNQFLQSSS